MSRISGIIAFQTKKSNLSTIYFYQFIVIRALFLFSAYLVFHIQIVTQVLTRNFVTYLNLKFKCTTVRSSFATEDDMRMSKHVL